MEAQNCTGVHYCMEATGNYGDEFLEFMQEEGDSLVSMVNPAQIKAFSQSILLRTKTDKADAGMIAFYAAKMIPEPAPRLKPEFKELRVLVRHLEHLKTKRADELGRMGSIIKNRLVLKSTRELIRHYDKQIAEMEKRIKVHLDNHQT